MAVATIGTAADHAGAFALGAIAVAVITQTAGAISVAFAVSGNRGGGVELLNHDYSPKVDVCMIMLNLMLRSKIFCSIWQLF